MIQMAELIKRERAVHPWNQSALPHVQQTVHFPPTLTHLDLKKGMVLTHCFSFWLSCFSNTAWTLRCVSTIVCITSCVSSGSILRCFIKPLALAKDIKTTLWTLYQLPFQVRSPAASKDSKQESNFFVLFISWPIISLRGMVWIFCCFFFVVFFGRGTSKACFHRSIVSIKVKVTQNCIYLFSSGTVDPDTVLSKKPRHP